MNCRREPSWLGDTSRWLRGNHSTEDVRERHFRELRERAAAKAAKEEQHKRASEESEARKLDLHDDGFMVLGNAILLAWHLDNPRADVLLQREIYSELVDLRELLEQQGALNSEISPREMPPWNVERERVRALFYGNADFARLRLKDLSRRTEAGMPPAVHDALMRASPGELRETIARLGRCPLTQSVRDWVMAYFRGAPLSAEADVTIGGPSSGSDRARETRADDVLREINVGDPEACLTHLSAENAVSKGGPRSGSDRARENRAAKVLQNIYKTDPEARLTQGRAFELLCPFFAAKKARDRVWQALEAPNWKLSGRPPGDQRLADEDRIKTLLSEV